MKQYLKLLQDIKDNGTLKPAAREGMPSTISLFGYQFRHDMRDGFPLLTTKEMYWKGIVVELLWFLRGDTNIKYLVDNGVNIWNEDAYNYYLKTLKKFHPKSDIKTKIMKFNPEISTDGDGIDSYRPFTFTEFVNFIKNSKKQIIANNDYSLGDCGHQYGKVWRKWNGKPYCVNFEHEINCEYIDQISNLINSLKNNPESRRHILTSIDPSHENDLALYWCHCLAQFNCRPLTLEQRIYNYDLIKKENYSLCPKTKRGIFLANKILDEAKIPKYYLDLQLYQRSADVFLGVPFNIASYSFLLHIFAKICNMIPGEFVHTFGDVHIYENHMDAVNEQLSRTPEKLPELLFKDSFHYQCDLLSKEEYSLDFILNLIETDFAIVNNYNPQPKIKAKLSTGLK